MPLYLVFTMTRSTSTNRLFCYVMFVIYVHRTQQARTDSVSMCARHSELISGSELETLLIYFGANMIKLISVECDDIWVVFAVGDDEQSTKLVESFSDAAVSQLIVSANCIALQLPVNR